MLVNVIKNNLLHSSFSIYIKKKCNPYLINLRFLSSHVVGTNINKLRFDLDASAIKTQTEALLDKYKQILDKIAKEKKEYTWDNTIKPLCDFDPEFEVSCSNFMFPAHVSTDKEIREASTEAEKIINSFVIEQSMREGVYKSVMEYAKKEEKIDRQDKRYLDTIVREYKRNGIHLSVTERDKIKHIKKQITDLSIQFQNNIKENKETVSLTGQQLEGLPKRVFSQLKSETIEGKMFYKVTLKSQEIIPALKYVKDVEARKKLGKAFISLCIQENTPILEQIISLRHELAKCLGYDNYSAFILENRMAKTTNNVKDFFAKLLPSFQTLARKELDLMLTFKKQELGDKSDNTINEWDVYYYGRMVVEKLYSVENEKNIKDYFPLEKVVSNTFDIFQELFGLRFKKLSGVHVWHPDVQTFEVSDKYTNQLIGHIYLDLYPREGKYSQNAVTVSLQKGCELHDQSWQFPSIAMICNFAKPQLNSPALLKHAEVKTFFHDDINVLHGLCSKAKHSKFSGTSTDRDFVECPSQMLENWCWEREILKKISCHYISKKPLPDAVFDKMLSAKSATNGLSNVMRLFYGVFDLTVHSQPTDDVASIYNLLRKEITFVEGSEGTNGAASFHHIVSGYDASYYGYLWSEVFASDMFEIFKKKGIMNPEIGKQYREIVLAPGGSKDGDDIIRDFVMQARYDNYKKYLD